MPVNSSNHLILIEGKVYSGVVVILWAKRKDNPPMNFSDLSE
jgi:hypothetical protein